jgi:hypothetical protein
MKTQNDHNALLRHTIHSIQTYAKQHQLNHRFVGGVSYGGLLQDETSYKIDIQARTVTLKNHTPLTLLRPDQSIRDIDLIILSQSNQQLNAFGTFIQKIKREAKQKTGLTPPISYEGMFELGQTPVGILQYVTTLHTDGHNKYLVFDKIQQRISDKSLEAWHVVLEDGLTYTTRNPLGDYFSYQFRSPSGIKPKDIQKIVHLDKLAKAIQQEGKKYNIDYLGDEYYGPWQAFINELETSTLKSVQQKKAITRWYWSTLGTTLAHGRGIIGKPIFALFNLLNRMR